MVVCEKQFVELANASKDITDPAAQLFVGIFPKKPNFLQPAKALFSGNWLPCFFSIYK